MNVLVTGSNGFIGHHICNFFKQKGFYVVGLGRKKESLATVDKYLNIDLDTNDIFDYQPDNHIDTVIHLAADMRKEPYCVDVVSANCSGTQRLLQFCEQNNIETFLQLSSLPVIGHPVNHPITESHPICPPTVYHCTKVMEEILADYAMRQKHIRTASFRISAPVGIGMNSKTILPTFVKYAIENQDIVIYGKGLRQQTYVHVNDIASGLYSALLSSRCSGVYNLSSFNRISNVDLAKLCVSLLNSKSKIVFNGLPDVYDSDIWDVSLDKIMRDTDFLPQISLEYCINELANCFKK